MGKVRKKIPLIIAIMLFLTSLSFLLFPTVSNAIYQTCSQGSIKEYDNNVSSLSKAEKEKYLNDAKAYNLSLTETVDDSFAKHTYEDIRPEYENVLNFGNGQICTVEIPKINVNLPVYHGISEDVLAKGAAHSANTSFPIGGKNTHSVISAHTAYPGKIFFDDLTELKKGDVFYINVLDEKLTYKVCDISIVKPDDTSKLQIVYGKDLVTLVTCYPYAVNSHRLLVTGERTKENKISTQEDSSTEQNYSINPIIFTVIGFALIISFISIIIIKRKNIDKHKRQ